MRGPESMMARFPTKLVFEYFFSVDGEISVTAAGAPKALASELPRGFAPRLCFDTLVD